MHRPNPEIRRCTEKHGAPATFAKGLVTLTTAHLCTCDPPCTNPSHVIATCQRCHLRIDRHTHALHASRTRSLKTNKHLTPPLNNATLSPGTTTRP